MKSGRRWSEIGLNQDLLDLTMAIYDICKEITILNSSDIGKRSVLFMISEKYLHFSEIEGSGTEASFFIINKKRRAMYYNPLIVSYLNIYDNIIDKLAYGLK